MRVKFNVITKTFRKIILASLVLENFFQIYVKHIITTWDILLAVHNFSELKNLDNNAQILVHAKISTYIVYHGNMAYDKNSFS